MKIKLLLVTLFLFNNDSHGQTRDTILLDFKSVYKGENLSNQPYYIVKDNLFPILNKKKYVLNWGSYEDTVFDISVQEKTRGVYNEFEADKKLWIRLKEDYNETILFKGRNDWRKFYNGFLNLKTSNENRDTGKLILNYYINCKSENRIIHDTIPDSLLRPDSNIHYHIKNNSSDTVVFVNYALLKNEDYYYEMTTDTFYPFQKKEFRFKFPKEYFRVFQHCKYYIINTSNPFKIENKVTITVPINIHRMVDEFESNFINQEVKTQFNKSLPPIDTLKINFGEVYNDDEVKSEFLIQKTSDDFFNNCKFSRDINNEDSIFSVYTPEDNDYGYIYGYESISKTKFTVNLKQSKQKKLPFKHSKTLKYYSGRYDNLHKFGTLIGIVKLSINKLNKNRLNINTKIDSSDKLKWKLSYTIINNSNEDLFFDNNPYTFDSALISIKIKSNSKATFNDIEYNTDCKKFSNLFYNNLNFHIESNKLFSKKITHSSIIPPPKYSDSCYPIIQLDSEVYNFGISSISSKDFTDTKYIKVKNIGKSPLLIMHCSTGDGGTFASSCREPILPGRTDKISIHMDATPRKYSRYLTIISNDLHYPNKTIKFEATFTE